MLHFFHYIFSLDSETLVRIFLLGGALVLFAGIFSIFLITQIFSSKQNKRKSKSHFDERQISAQNQAYRWSTYVTISYFLSFYIACIGADFFEIEILPTRTIILLGIAIAASVFAGICIFKDAYIAIHQKKKLIITSFSLLAASSAINFFSSITFLNTDNLPDMTYDHFIFILLWTTILIFFIIKAIIDKKAEKEY